MTFPPGVRMTFPRILQPVPGYTYDRVTLPALPPFAVPLTTDRYSDTQQPMLPILRVPQYSFGGLGMLTVPVSNFLRAAANGLGSLGETEAERISRLERERIQREYGNIARPGARPAGGGAPAPTTAGKGGGLLANVFGPGGGSGGSTSNLPPGTEPGSPEDGATSSNATPGVSTAAPSWGLYVGLGVLVVGGAVLAWSIWGKKAPTSNRRRYRRNPVEVPDPFDPVYTRDEKFRGWTRLTSPSLGEWRLLLPRLRGWSKGDHVHAAKVHFNAAKKVEQEWIAASDAAERRYGSQGPLISAGLREHWPSQVKDRVRGLAHRVTAHRAAAKAHEQAARSRMVPR